MRKITQTQMFLVFLNCEILKFGKALVVADVKVYSEGTEKPVARASITYSIPPKN